MLGEEWAVVSSVVSSLLHYYSLGSWETNLQQEPEVIINIKTPPLVNHFCCLSQRFHSLLQASPPVWEEVIQHRSL